MYSARRRQQAAIPIFRRGVDRSTIRAGKSRPDSAMAHPPRGSAQKERIRFALYCVAVILRRVLCQGASKAFFDKQRKGGRRLLLIKPRKRGQPA